MSGPEHSVARVVLAQIVAGELGFGEVLYAERIARDVGCDHMEAAAGLEVLSGWGAVVARRYGYRVALELPPEEWLGRSPSGTLLLHTPPVEQWPAGRHWIVGITAEERVAAAAATPVGGLVAEWIEVATNPDFVVGVRLAEYGTAREAVERLSLGGEPVPDVRILPIPPRRLGDPVRIRPGMGRSTRVWWRHGTRTGQLDLTPDGPQIVVAPEGGKPLSIRLKPGVVRDVGARRFWQIETLMGVLLSRYSDRL